MNFVDIFYYITVIFYTPCTSMLATNTVLFPHWKQSRTSLRYNSTAIYTCLQSHKDTLLEKTRSCLLFLKLNHPQSFPPRIILSPVHERSHALALAPAHLRLSTHNSMYSRGMQIYAVSQGIFVYGRRFLKRGCGLVPGPTDRHDK